MNRLGFRNLGGYQAEGATHSTWWNLSGEQCVKVATREAKVADIGSIYAGNCRWARASSAHKAALFNRAIRESRAR